MAGSINNDLQKEWYEMSICKLIMLAMCLVVTVYISGCAPEARPGYPPETSYHSNVVEDRKVEENNYIGPGVGYVYGPNGPAIGYQYKKSPFITFGKPFTSVQSDWLKYRWECDDEYARR